MPPALIIFAILLFLLVGCVIGRPRYDVVAMLCLLAGVLTGVVPAAEAFLGFGHPAVVTVAAMLVISAGLTRAGVVDVLARWLERAGERPTLQTGAQTTMVSALSGFMNNVGAVALLIPVAVRIARRIGQSPSTYLMPLAFGSLLGGLVTLIGTPPNIIIATFRADAVGEPFGMFDFAPVGAPLAVAGVLLISLVGWRLMPKREGAESRDDLFRIEEYTVELVVPEDSKAVGQALRGLVEQSGADVQVAGIVRGNDRELMPQAYAILHAEDHLIVEGDPEELERFVKEAGLKLETQADDEALGRPSLGSDEVEVIEAVVLPESPLYGRTPLDLRLRERYGVNLLAVARQGQPQVKRLGEVTFRAGDVLLLQLRREDAEETIERLRILPLGDATTRFAPQRGLWPSVLAFGTAIALTSLGVLAVEVAFAAVAVLFVILRLVPLEGVYDEIDWPIIVLLAALIPIGQALETTGGTELIVNGLLAVADGLPAYLTLGLLLLVAMVLTNVINNAAAAVLLAPLAVAFAQGLGASPDAYLMAVAVGAGSAFLTPIGHQSATLVLEPGGYRFGDYARLGIPLTLMVLLLGVPLLLIVWGG